MGWAVGERNGRHIGYGVPATCDQPGCGKAIDRGLAYQCGDLTDDEGCGLYFCQDHLYFAEGRNGQLCDQCVAVEPPYEPTPDVGEWVQHVLTDESWAPFRSNYPEWTQQYRERAAELGLEVAHRG